MDWKSIGTQLAKIGLPILGGAVGGPGGALIAKGLTAALGIGDEATPEQTAAALGNLSGDQLVQMRQIEANLASEQIKSETALATAQIEVNKVEASQSSLFKGGWRPAVGWVCVAGLAYVFLVRPLLPWVIKVIALIFGLDASAVPELPPLDITELLSLLGGMLGLSGWRSLERRAGKV